MQLELLRTEVLRTANLLSQYGLVWMAGGTVCACDSQTGYVVVTPSGLPYEKLSPEDMVVTDIDMKPVEGKYRPSVALNLWTSLLRARPDLQAVVHTHSPYATAFAVAGQPIPVVTETMADWFGRSVSVTPYRSVDDPEFASLPVEILGEGFAVLLGNHGVITVGASLAHALERAVTLEEAAHTYVISKSIGTPCYLNDAQAMASFVYYFNQYGQRTTQSQE
ncbi:MAG: class II aldolase/adducin family protein [Anaerolineales bacterium]|nr:class II aldolase/adducin family protein [Anaerolineales bacterium]